VTEITAERSEARRRLPGAADFWRLWLIGLIVFTVRWIEMLVFAVFAYQVTGSAFIVTMLTMLRMLPLALFGAFMGAVADRFDRRRALLVMPVILFAISIAAMMLAGAGRLEIWHLAVLAFVNGVAWASDNTIRRVMIGDVVGGEGMATAMALDTGANNASRMLGPALGGALFAAWGAAAPFAASAGLYAVAIGLAIGLHHRNHVAVKPALSMFGLITEGLRAVRHSRKLSGIFPLPRSSTSSIGHFSVSSPSSARTRSTSNRKGSACSRVWVALARCSARWRWCWWRSRHAIRRFSSAGSSCFKRCKLPLP